MLNLVAENKYFIGILLIGLFFSLFVKLYSNRTKYFTKDLIFTVFVGFLDFFIWKYLYLNTNQYCAFYSSTIISGTIGVVLYNFIKPNLINKIYIFLRIYSFMILMGSIITHITTLLLIPFAQNLFTEYNTAYLMKILSILASYLVLAFLQLIYEFKKNPIQIRNTKIRSISIYFLIILIIAVLNYILCVNYVHKLTLIGFIYIFLLISLKGASTFLYLSIKRYELDYQNKNGKSLEDFSDDLRRVKHNYNNILAAIAGYLSANKGDNLKEYYKTVLNQGNKLNNLETILNPKIKNPAIIGLLQAKVQYASEKGVKIVLSIYGEIDFVNMKICDFSELLGIFIDNAIEAAAESLEKEVTIVMTNNDSACTFKIQNSYKEKPVIHKMFEKGYSSKGEGRGLGLWIVCDILEGYKNVDLNTNAKGPWFSQELVIR